MCYCGVWHMRKRLFVFACVVITSVYLCGCSFSAVLKDTLQALADAIPEEANVSSEILAKAEEENSEAVSEGEENTSEDVSSEEGSSEEASSEEGSSKDGSSKDGTKEDSKDSSDDGKEKSGDGKEKSDGGSNEITPEQKAEKIRRENQEKERQERIEKEKAEEEERVRKEEEEKAKKAEEEKKKAEEEKKKKEEAEKQRQEEEKRAEEERQKQIEEQKRAEEEQRQNSVADLEANAGARMIEMINQKRAEAGLGALTLDPTLCALAKVRADEIVTVFDHTRPDGRSCFTVLTDSGVAFGTAGENIAAGYPSVDAAFNAWMNSEGHRANLLNPGFNKIGIGFTYNPDGTYGYYWTQVFTD